MTEDALRSLATWIKPAVLQLTPEELDVYRKSVELLSEGPIEADMVTASHGHVSPEAQLKIESAVRQFDTTFLGEDQTELIARIAAAAVMYALLNKPTKAAAPIALLVQSAEFVGLRPKIVELLDRANFVVDTESRRARTRSAFKKQPAQLHALQPAATSEEIVPVLNSAIRRLEEALATAYSRLEQTEEEVDTLWWSRSQNSYSAGKPWSQIEGPERVIFAALELSDILKFYPPTLGELTILRDVGGQPGGSVKLTTVGSALSASALAGTELRGTLFPLSTAASLAAEHGDKNKALGSLIESAGCNPKMAIPVNELATQIMREMSLAQLS